MSEIQNKCKTKDFLKLSEIEAFATDVKNRTGYDIQRLKESIMNNGFLFPLFIWKNKNIILDGKARYLALKQLEKEGNVLKDVPVVFVEAKDENEAKEKVLQVNSRYGKITEGSLNFFAKDCKIDLSDLNIHLDKINFSFDNKADLVKRGSTMVIGGSMPPVPPQPTQSPSSLASMALDIGGSQQPAENVFGGNDGSIEQTWADSQQSMDIPSFAEQSSEPSPFEIFEPEEGDNQFEPQAETSEPSTTTIEGQAVQPLTKVPFTCPFCYTQFELIFDEIKEILAQ